MSPRHWQQRIHDMIVALEDIQRLAAGKTAADLATERTTYLAILYNFVVVGEAAREVPGEVCELHPEIDWDGMRGMRNVLTHKYFGVDEARVHRAIVESVPRTLVELRAVVEKGSGAP